MYSRPLNAIRPLGRLRIACVILDPLLVAAALPLTALLRPGPEAHWERYIQLAAMLVPVTSFWFFACGAYADRVLRSTTAAVGRAGVALIVVSTALLLTIFTLQIGEQLSRIAVLLWMPVAFALVALNRLAGSYILQRSQSSGRLDTKVVLVGNARQIFAVGRHLDQHPELGLRVAGLCSDELVDAQHGGIPAKPVAALAELVAEVRASRAIVCAGLGDHRLSSEALRQLLPSAVTVDLVPDFSDLPVFCLRAGELAGMPVLALSSSPMSETAVIVKWIEDKVLGTVFLLCAAPVMVLVAVGIKLASPGPVLFKQQRHGMGGRIINVYKFRSMHHAAPAAGSPPPPDGPSPSPALISRAAIMTTPPFGTLVEAVDVSETREAGGSTRLVRRNVRGDTPPGSRVVGDLKPDDFKQATGDDPRIFPLGRFLRRSSLDELPQFLNVLRGDMSIVGPRPHAIRHNQQFTGDIVELMRRHYVKPGITGLAQISGARGETRTVADMRKRVSLDLEYIRTWSLWLDLRIIVLTVFKGFINRQP